MSLAQSEASVPTCATAALLFTLGQRHENRYAFTAQLGGKDTMFKYCVRRESLEACFGSGGPLMGLPDVVAFARHPQGMF